MTSELISARSTPIRKNGPRGANYNLLAIPVVDDENKLVGIITVDDVIDVIKDEATEDILRLAGVSADEHIATSPWEAWRKRLPWLGINLVAATLGALVIRQFQATIEQVVALAALMTVVASVSGNAAIQTLTVIVRGLAIGELAWSNARRVLGKEVLVGIANGLLLGLVGSVIAWLVFGNPYVGAILAGAMVINLLVAAIAATLIPLALRALKFDPALASAVFITTMTDMFGFLPSSVSPPLSSRTCSAASDRRSGRTPAAGSPSCEKHGGSIGGRRMHSFKEAPDDGIPPRRLRWQTDAASRRAGGRTGDWRRRGRSARGRVARRNGRGMGSLYRGHREAHSRRVRRRRTLPGPGFPRRTRH